MRICTGKRSIQNYSNPHFKKIMKTIVKPSGLTRSTEKWVAKVTITIIKEVLDCTQQPEHLTRQIFNELCKCNEWMNVWMNWFQITSTCHLWFFANLSPRHPSSFINCHNFENRKHFCQDKFAIRFGLTDYL